VSPNYFATVGTRIFSGRSFTEGDGPAATPVIAVNALFAKRFLAGLDPIGAWVKVSGKDRQIVAVVEDGPYNSLFQDPQPFLYFPFAQKPVAYQTWFIAARSNAGSLAAPVRAYLRGADADLTLYSTQTLAVHMRNARSENQLAATVAGSLAAVGLLLAAAGLFGVTLFAVTRRTREFGVRLAMGATGSRLIGQVLREAGLRVAVAIPLGWLLAYAGRKAIAKMLYGVAPDDPWTFAGATCVAAAVAVLAALHPAIRASRVDPMSALRHERRSRWGYHRSMFILHVHIHVLPEHLEAFKQATIVNATNSRKEPGVARFDFVQVIDDPTRFGLVEVYRDRAAVDAHKQTAHYAEWVQKVEPWLAEPRTRVFYENIDPDDRGW
jgi:putative ABC transport system permease protein